MPADLADRVDDQLAGLLRDLRELGVVEARQVPGPSMLRQQRRLCVFSLMTALVWMKSVINSRSLVSPSASPSAALGRGVGLGGELARAVEAEEADVGELSVPLV